MKLPLLDLSLVSVARYLREAILMVRGLLLAWILEPTGFGVWTSMRLVVTFSKYAHVGARSGMVQRAAYEDGSGNHELAAEYRRTGAGIDLLGAGVVAAVLVAAVLLRGAEHTGWWLEVAALVFISHVYGYYMTVLVSQRIFPVYAAAMVTFAALTTVVGLWAAWRFGLGGLLFAIMGAHVAVLAAAVVLGPGYPRPRLDLALARQLIVIGFPIMAASAAQILQWNTDKLFIWTMRGSEPLGVYAIQAVFTNGVLLLPTVVHQVVRPHLLQQLGRSGTDDVARHYLERGTLLLGLVACPVIGVVFLILHAPIRWLLPQYVDAIAPGELIVIMIFFALAASVPSTVLVSLGAAWSVIAVRLVGVATAATTIAVVLQRGGGFVGVAGGTAAGLVVSGVLTLALAFRRTRLPAAVVVRVVLGLALGYALLIALVLGLTTLIPDAADEWTTDVVRTALRCVLLVVLFLPPIVLAIRRLDLLKPQAAVDDEDEALEVIEPDSE